MRTKDNYGWLDGFRLTAALLVIAIHTSPLGSFSPEGDFFLTRILARTAVPFFFMVTGQFVAVHFIEDKGTGKDWDFLRRYLRKILVLYAAAIVLYLPIGIYAGHYQNMTILSFLKMLLFDGTFYHLWYFPACLLGVSLVYLMSRFFNLRILLTVSLFLYGIGLLGDSYFGLAQKLPGAGIVYELFFQICTYTRNGLFFAPLFLTLGIWCAKGSRRGLSVHAITLALSFLLMTGEAFTLRYFSWQRHDSMYVMLIPVMVSLYRTLLCLPPLFGKPAALPLASGNPPHGAVPGEADIPDGRFLAFRLQISAKRLRSASLWIYMLHPAFIVVVRGAARVLRLTPLLVDNSLVHYLTVSLLSVGAGFGIAFLSGSMRVFFHKARRPLGGNEEPGKPHSQYSPLHREDWDEPERSRTLTNANVKRAAADGSGKQTLTTPNPLMQDRDKSGRSCPSPCARAWIELDMDALARNVDYLYSLMPEGCRLMPAVKANAYGHGAVLIARELNRLGVDAFCVACLSEGISLRKAKVKGEILILGYTLPEDFRLLARYKLTQTVVDYDYAQKLANAGITLHVHIGIDTGMHRLGIPCENTGEILSVFDMGNLIIDGMFTHLCACDSPLPENEAFTQNQIQSFYRVAGTLEAQGIPRPRLHLQSSYGLMNYPGLDADYVRAGIALYGVPSQTEDKALFQGRLTPVLSLMARIASLRTLYAGESAGYGLAFTAERKMQIAVLSIGYADGLPRELSCSKGYVLLHGCKAPIIGRICMDQTLIDVSGVPQVSAGDIAILIGTSGQTGITADQLAGWCGTITNELLSRMGERLERIETIMDSEQAPTDKLHNQFRMVKPLRHIIK